MDTTSLLLLFFAIQERSCDKDKTYCTSQRGSIRVEDKGSVTISCNFTYPKSEDRPVDVRVSWRRGGQDRCGKGEFIYNHTDGWIHSDYKGRISPVGNPKEGTATITINNLQRTKDRPMFCCRVEIYQESKLIQAWQDRPGTFIQYKDELSVEQTDVVPAITGEDIIIPCLVHYKGSSRIEEVTWSAGSNDVCSDNTDRTETWKQNNKSQTRNRWSVVNFPYDLSLRITGVTLQDYKQYCCGVQTTLRSNVVSPIHGTEVVLVDTSKNPKLEIVQPATTKSVKDGSATLNCPFTHQSDYDLLRIVVFWRVSSPTGSYAYHPLTNMIDPDYSGRTELSGPADLHIKGVRGTDNTTYYCITILKFCVGNNKTTSTIWYGNGTQLQVTVIADKAASKVWLYVLAALLPALIILCAIIIIIVLKRKGVICQKRSGLGDVNYLTSDITLKDQNPSDGVRTPSAATSAAPTAQEHSGGILYAHLNVTSLQQKTSNQRKESRPDDSQVLYATVKPTNASQDIYSTVK